MKCIEFVPSELSEKQWISYFKSRERINIGMNPDDPLPSRDGRRAYMLNPNPNYHLSWWQALEGKDKVVGMGGVWWATEESPAFQEEKDVAYADMILESKYRTEENQFNFLQHLVSKAIEIGKSTFIIETRGEHQYSFLSKLGGTIISDRATNRLAIKNVDMTMIKQWCEEGPQRAPGVTLERFRSVPEKEIDQFVILYTETWNQAPLEDVSPEFITTPESRRTMERYFEEQNETWTTVVSRESNGAISGLTEIWHNPNAEYFIEQGLTGVSEKYRGRGLGKWLKAEMFRFIVETYPQASIIQTGNANSNKPMLSINEKMGFKQYRKMWIVSFDTEKILDLLNEI